MRLLDHRDGGHMAVVQQPSGRDLDFTDGHEIVLVESPETIARACVALLSDPERCRAIGTAARQNAAARCNQLKNVIAPVRQRLRSISIAETRASINRVVSSSQLRAPAIARAHSH